jgi:hypothetical protein
MNQDSLMPVAQKELMGCAIACVGFVLSITYEEASRLFHRPEQAGYDGYMCADIVDALSKRGVKCRIRKSMSGPSRVSPGTIVFLGKSAKYPTGHYVVKTNGGWMNPWENFPRVDPAIAKIAKYQPPGLISYEVIQEAS